MTTARIVDEINQTAPPGSTVAFVSGNFNILHPGHLRLLQFARECADFLVVGVFTNRMVKGGALIDESHRLEALRSNTSVNFSFLLDEPAAEFIAALKPAVVVKGKEHENRFNAEAEAVASSGGRLLFGSGDTVFSASNLLKQELRLDAPLHFEFPTEYGDRHGFTAATLRSLIQRSGEARICVIGDVIVDEYVTCEALGMSQEDPTLVVTPAATQIFLGGAGIVAAHCAGLGATVNFFSVTGDDEAREFADEKLKAAKVTSVLLPDETRPTTRKQRFRAAGKTLLRVNHLRQHGISKEIQEQLMQRILPVLDQTDALVFSDFNYGCLPQALVDRITLEARQRNIILIADSQCSSQIGDISRFKHMNLITPTEMEARVSTRNHDDGLVILAEAVRRQAEAQNVLLKLGAEGLMVHATCATQKEWETDQLPSFNRHPKDTAGAGDSVLAAAAVTLALGGHVWQASLLGSFAAACQVSRLGNTPLTNDELCQALQP